MSQDDKECDRRKAKWVGWMGGVSVKNTPLRIDTRKEDREVPSPPDSKLSDATSIYIHHGRDEVKESSAIDGKWIVTENETMPSI